MEYKVDELKYENSLGSIVLSDIVVDMEQDQIKLYENGSHLENLDFGLNGLDIERTEDEKLFEASQEINEKIVHIRFGCPVA